MRLFLECKERESPWFYNWVELDLWDFQQGEGKIFWEEKGLIQAK